MTYSVINIVPSSCFGEQSDEENDYGGDGQWDGKTRWDHVPKVKVRAEELGVIGNKLCDHIQKEFRPSTTTKLTTLSFFFIFGL
jgi:hypothetical protein